jgi:hypothetical protein
VGMGAMSCPFYAYFQVSEACGGIREAIRQVMGNRGDKDLDCL